MRFLALVLTCVSLRAAALHVREKTRIFRKDVLPFAAGLQAGAYDLAFADPPYGSRQLDRLIETWQATPFATVLTVEHAYDHALPPAGETYDFDETSVTIFRVPVDQGG